MFNEYEGIMGSYDYTCAVSELGIGAGTEVYLIALARTDTGLNSGPQSVYSVAFPPIKASYDDYGFVDDIVSTPFHEACAKKFDGKSLKQFCEGLSEGNLMARFRGTQIPLRFCMVRQDAWSKLMELPMPSDGYGASGSDMADLVEPAAREGAELFATARATLHGEEFAPLREKIEKGEYEQDRMAMLLLNGYILDKADPKGPFAKLLSGQLASRGGDSLFLGSASEALALDMPEADAPLDAFQDALRLCGEFCCMNYSMFMLRKCWAPRDSSGPQCGEFAMHWLWARSLAELASSEIQWNEDDHYLAGIDQAKSLRDRDAIASSTGVALSPAAKPKGI